MKMKSLLTTLDNKIYNVKTNKNNIENYRYFTILRNIAVLELLFGTGVRVSEISSLKLENIDLTMEWIRILGKGDKETEV